MKAHLYQIDFKGQSDVYGLGKESVKREISRLNELCEQGDATAMRALGTILIDGVDAKDRKVKADPSRGYKLLEQAASLGDVMAGVFLGYCYFVGHRGLKRDLIKSLELFEKAAQADCAEGKYCLANYYINLHDGAGHEKRIFSLMEEASAYGLIDARLRLAELYSRGLGVRKSIKKAVAILEELDAINIPEAAWELAVIYRGKSMKKALPYLEKAAAAGVPDALSDLARHYETGSGVPRDREKALSLFRRCHELEPDDAEISFKLAELLLLSRAELKEAHEGEGTECLKQAAAAKYPAALLMEGFFHLSGDFGFEKDEKAAREMILAAGDTDCVKAQLELGRMYREGLLFVKDAKEALKYFRRAADARDGEALYELGCMYRDGEGVVKSRHKALDYFRQSAAQGAPFGRFEYGRMLTESEDPKRVREGMEQIEQAGAEGVPDAFRFLRDRITAKKDAAREELEQAVYYDHALGAMTFALMYSTGMHVRPPGVEMPLKLAYKILKEAVETYDFDSDDDRTYVFCGLARCQEAGIGCKVSLKYAVTLYETGVSLKDPYACLSLARLYGEGLGVEKDLDKARELIQKGRGLVMEKYRKYAKGTPGEEKEQNEVSLGADFVFSGNTVQ